MGEINSGNFSTLQRFIQINVGYYCTRWNPLEFVWIFRNWAKKLLRDLLKHQEDDYYFGLTENTNDLQVDDQRMQDIRLDSMTSINVAGNSY